MVKLYKHLILHSNNMAKKKSRSNINFSIMEVTELSTTFYCSKLSHTQIKEIAKDTNLHLNPVAQTFFKLVV